MYDDSVVFAKLLLTGIEQPVVCRSIRAGRTIDLVGRIKHIRKSEIPFFGTHIARRFRGKAAAEGGRFGFWTAVRSGRYRNVWMDDQHRSQDCARFRQWRGYWQ